MQNQPARLEALSTGQKATAVLLLLLLESDGPLIIDQPEDDLDNRFITEGVVPIMAQEKRWRQFFFYNANIPVLGNAPELIVGLAASAEGGEGHAKIESKYMGSIDSKPVRELVEEIPLSQFLLDTSELQIGSPKCRFVSFRLVFNLTTPNVFGHECNSFVTALFNQSVQ